MVRLLLPRKRHRTLYMDLKKWTSKSYLRYIVPTLLSAVIIGYFIKNNTHTEQNYFKQAISLPKNASTILEANSNSAPAPVSITKTVEFKTGIIHHSIDQAARDAGLTRKMTRQLDSMFASDYRARKIHVGDRLEVLYHEYFLGNQKDHPGHIVAAKIIDPHYHNLSLVRFTTPNNKANYYTPTATSTKPIYLTTPVHYFRMASGFSYSRLDPVIHKVHPHLGVDLDAPMGTPIKAIGNGIVIYCNKMHGYGNVVMIKYNRTYKTLYAHLEKFAKHMHLHKHVKKGEVVGYVGVTGWTTGPHLHYSLYKNGKPINPLTAHFPDITLPAKYRSAFFHQENRWLTEMKLFESTLPPVKKNNATKHIAKSATHDKKVIAKAKHHHLTHHTKLAKKHASKLIKHKKLIAKKTHHTKLAIKSKQHITTHRHNA